MPGGVLAVGWVAQDDAALAEARAIFDVVAPTLTLARPFSETAGPLPPVGPDAPQPPPDPAAVPDGWPGRLTGLSKPLEASDYSLAGLGTALSLTLGDGWSVQPNFPSWAVLTGDDSFGASDRGIQFRSGVDQLLPAIRSGDAGDGVPFDPRAMMSTPPDNIEVLESETVDLGGAQGVRIRITFDATADCATEICEYMVTTIYPFPPTSLRPVTNTSCGTLIKESNNRSPSSSKRLTLVGLHPPEPDRQHRVQHRDLALLRPVATKTESSNSALQFRPSLPLTVIPT